MTTTSTTDTTFTCSDGVIISSLRLRDGMRDCGGGEDEKEEQQTIVQAEKSLLDMLKSNPFDSFKEEKVIEIDGDGVEGVVQEEKVIEINGDGDKEKEDLTETLLRVRGTNILSGIPSTSIR